MFKPGSRRNLAGLALTVLVSTAVFWFVTSAKTSNSDLLVQGLKAIEIHNDTAIEQVREKLLKNGGKAERAILDAQIALSRSDFDEAISLSWLAESLLPSARAYTWPVQTESLYQLGRLSEAEDQAREWANAQPDHPAAHRWLASIYYDLGAMEQARTHLIRLIELRPGDHAARYLLGIVYHDYERFTEAAAAFEGLLNTPGAPASMARDSTLRLGDSLIRLHRYEEAVNRLRPLSDSAVAQANCAESLIALGRVEEARTFLDSAAAIDSAEIRVLDVQAQLQMQDRDYSSAEASLNALLAKEPGNVTARYALAQCLRALGKADDADRQLKQHAEYQQALITLADLHREAITKPWDPGTRDRIADLFQEIGDQEKEMAWRRAADVCRQAQTPVAAPVPRSSASSAMPQKSGSQPAVIEF